MTWKLTTWPDLNFTWPDLNSTWPDLTCFKFFLTWPDLTCFIFDLKWPELTWFIYIFFVDFGCCRLLNLCFLSRGFMWHIRIIEEAHLSRFGMIIYKTGQIRSGQKKFRSGRVFDFQVQVKSGQVKIYKIRFRSNQVSGHSGQVSGRPDLFRALFQEQI